MRALALLLPLAAALRPSSHSARSGDLRTFDRRAAVGVAAVAATSCCVASAAAVDANGAAGAIQGALESLGKPGIEVEYGGPYMNRDTGSLTYPVSGVKAADPLSAALLALGAGATRFGGLLPDEMPFNIVQKLLRAILPNGLLPDYADDDFRKQFQDTWYGTNEQANLPEWLQSRKSTPPPPPPSVEGVEQQQEAQQPLDRGSDGA